jgi:signal transduction histidine kinase/CheY-like chemotaxis protein/HPt (histidine-containing phosphotransfer) domain-containing protein
MAFYHIGLYLMRRKEWSTLFLALFCLVIAIRTSVTGEIILHILFPGLNWELLYTLMYLSFYLGVPLFIHFIYLLYPGDVWQRIVPISWIAAILFSISVLATPVKLYSTFVLWYELITIAFLLYILLVVLIRAMLRKREGAVFFFLGTIVIVISAINDVLVANEVLFGPYIIDFGLFAFLFLHTTVLSARFSKAFVTVEKLSEELKEYNQALEEKVIERTRDLEQAKKAAEMANCTKNDFLAVMSHEIRTPISGITGMVELLLDKPLSGELKEYAVAIRDSSEMLLAIINDLLDFSMIEEGRLALNEVEFDLRSVEKNVTGLIGPQAGHKGLRLNSCIDPETPRVLRGDPVRLGQVLLNLLGNAVKFTERGEVSLRIAPASMDAGSAAICFEVRDTGPGVPDNAREKIFAPFTQADASTTRKYGGTGLGLSITKKIVQQMNGTIEVNSTLGKGSTFKCTLPFRLSDNGNIGGVSRDGEGFIHYRQDLAGLRILVAEDNSISQKYIKALLEYLNCDVTLASNGREVLGRLKTGAYDCILMDKNMPELDGAETTRIIRRGEKDTGGHIPIIALTASAIVGDREKLLEEGMDYYLSKPMKKFDLVNILTAVKSGTACEKPPESANASREDGYINRQVFLEEADLYGNEVFMEIISIFMEEYRQVLLKIEDHIGNKDLVSAERAIHKFAGTLSTFYCGRLVNVVKELERKAAEKDIESLSSLFPVFKENIELFIAELNELAIVIQKNCNLNAYRQKV